jgi:cyclic beta-1,2-glucan synthetase
VRATRGSAAAHAALRPHALEPGYIKGYLPGVRENGGQYTHAAAWAIIAFAALGDGDRAGELLPRSTRSTTRAPRTRWIATRSSRTSWRPTCTPSRRTRRGGWTWYTGSAGWMYRAGLESLLGVRVRGERLEIDPCIPRAWDGFRVTLRHRATQYEIRVENPRGVSRGVAAVTLDGRALDAPAAVPLVDDGAVHQVHVVLG